MPENIYKRHLSAPFLKILIDLIAIECAVLFSYYLRFYSPLTRLIPVKDNYYPPLENYIYFSFVISVIYLILFSVFRAYRSRFFSTFTQDIPVIFKTGFLGTLFAMSAAFLYRGFSYSRVVFLLIFLTTAVMLLAGRYLFHQIRKKLLQKGFSTLRVLLVGSSSNLARVYRQLVADKNYNLEIGGYLAEREIADLPAAYIGNFGLIPEISQSDRLDGLVISFNQDDHQRVWDIIRAVEGKNIELFYVPDILDILTSHFNNLEIGGIPILQLKSFTLSGWQGLIKRGFDLGVSTLSLILLSPLFLLIAILIKLESQGPVLYKQQRVTMNDRDFIMLKFRSMHVTEESKHGLKDVVKDDPRITRIGKFLRRTSLDELPQLYNVLKGEMSLVGPRPERRYYVDQNQKTLPRYSERHRVRCGITGWAQVSGLRQQNTSLEERIRYDLFYIENWSLWFDLKIIIMTFAEVVRGENAY
jgi:exopolysaccharide biosynthesis polyprenyl glycosylphosphotransferase